VEEGGNLKAIPGVARGREARGEEGETLIRPARQYPGGRDVEDRWKKRRHAPAQYCKAKRENTGGGGGREARSRAVGASGGS
jgi:hypothetical protein